MQKLKLTFGGEPLIPDLARRACSCLSRAIKRGTRGSNSVYHGPLVTGVWLPYMTLTASGSAIESSLGPGTQSRQLLLQ